MRKLLLIGKRVGKSELINKKIKKYIYLNLTQTATVV